LLHWDNCAYWAEEKRPDIWRNAVLQPDGGYTHGAGGAWNIKIDAARYHYRISHLPKVGDIAAWPPNAKMGTHKSGTRTITHYASPGGHVAYVERVRGRQITISTTGLDTAGGYTFSLKFNRTRTFFIHRGRTV
jgi:surface antigen